MGQYKDLAEMGVGGFLMYQRKSAKNMRSSFIEAEYLGFGEKKTFGGALWLSTKMSMLNLKVGQKFFLFKGGNTPGLFVSAEIGTSTIFLNGDSNFGPKLKTQETDFAYAPGVGYSFKKFDIWYSVQFVRISGGLSPSNNSHSTTIDYSSCKISYTF